MGVWAAGARHRLVSAGKQFCAYSVAEKTAAAVSGRHEILMPGHVIRVATAAMNCIKF